MENFVYGNRTLWIFGRGTEARLGEFVERFAGTRGKVLLHFGGGSVVRNGLYALAKTQLQERGIAFVELGGVVPNPRLSLVREGIELCRREGVTFILALGGGSVIDSAKAIAAGVPEENGDVWETFVSRPPLKRALDVATVLTIPATGSEMSPNTVITDETSGYKLGYGDEHLRPVFSIVNPELFFTLPQNQIANGVSDMMSHIFERYFSNTPHCEITDGLCAQSFATRSPCAKIRTTTTRGRKSVSRERSRTTICSGSDASRIGHATAWSTKSARSTMSRTAPGSPSLRPRGCATCCRKKRRSSRSSRAMFSAFPQVRTTPQRRARESRHSSIFTKKWGFP